MFFFYFVYAWKKNMRVPLQTASLITVFNAPRKQKQVWHHHWIQGIMIQCVCSLKQQRYVNKWASHLHYKKNNIYVFWWYKYTGHSCRMVRGQLYGTFNWSCCCLQHGQDRAAAEQQAPDEWTHSVGRWGRPLGHSSLSGRSKKARCHSFRFPTCCAVSAVVSNRGHHARNHNNKRTRLRPVLRGGEFGSARSDTQRRRLPKHTVAKCVSRKKKKKTLSNSP